MIEADKLAELVTNDSFTHGRTMADDIRELTDDELVGFSKVLDTWGRQVTGELSRRAALK